MMLGRWTGFHTILVEDGKAGYKREFNQSSDPRVGSARDNSTTTNIGNVSTGTNSSSGFQLLMTLAPVLIYATVCILIFIALRRKFPRVYAPRTFLSSLQPHEKSIPLPGGWFNWIKAFYQVPDSYVLNHSTLDGFLFLRYIKILIVICTVGCLLTWPVLIPLHVHGGNGEKELNALTFGNVKKPSWYFVHTFLAWIYFGFILYMVNRESIYFINLRQAYLLSPFYASRISSRTVLFTCVPQQYLDEKKLRALFEGTAKSVWIPKDTEDLDRLIKEREQTANRLEKAEIVLLKKANTARNAAIKEGPKDILRNIRRGPNKEPVSSRLFSGFTRNVKRQKEPPVASPITTKDGEISQRVFIAPLSPSNASQSDSHPEENLEKKVDEKGDEKGSSEYGFSHLPDVNGSVASQWIPHSDRPTHRPLANMGRSVDTIKWTRNRLKIMRTQIKKLRRAYRMGKSRPMPAAFIEFHTQSEAQAAYQTLAHHRPFHMIPVNVGVRPSEISWPTLKLRWWERVIRKFLIQGLITAMVIFWSIPSALVGIISNISFLTSKVFFLRWLNLLPSPILGLISGLLPAVALHLLMSLVPGIMRSCARLSGVPTLSLIELFAQNAYFVFLVVQVFIVTTLTSAASGAVTQILDNPMSARGLLSENIPKASNFYISYFILQGLALSANRIVHLLSFVRLQITQRNLTSPRILYTRYHRLRRIHWGSIFPIFTNMGVIAITYSCIAPIILGFAAVGLCFVYAAYRYNLIYVYDSENDTRGLHYPRALQQTLTGLYLAEICMIGLFGIGGGFGPVFLMIVLLILTVLIHVSLNDALGPLLYNIPRTLAVPQQAQDCPVAENEFIDSDNFGDQTNLVSAEDLEEGHIDEDFIHPSEQLALDAAAVDGPNSSTPDGPIGTRAVEGASDAAALGTKIVTGLIRGKIDTGLESNPAIKRWITKIDFWTFWIKPDPTQKPSIVLKWLHPEVFEDYDFVKEMIPEGLPEAIYPEDMARHAYDPPSLSAPEPRLWIPRDLAGVSRQEVVHSGKVVPITDEDAFLNEKNMLEVDLSIPHPELMPRLRC